MSLFTLSLFQQATLLKPNKTDYGMPSSSVSSLTGIIRSSRVTFIYKMTFDAIYMEEYVPMTTPIIKATANPWVVSPPMNSTEKSTSNVVNDVMSVLLKV